MQMSSGLETKYNFDDFIITDDEDEKRPNLNVNKNLICLFKSKS